MTWHEMTWHDMTSLFLYDLMVRQKVADMSPSNPPIFPTQSWGVSIASTSCMLRAQIAPRSGIFPIFAVSACVLKKLSSTYLTYLNLFFNSCCVSFVHFFVVKCTPFFHRLDPVRQAPVSPWIPGIEEHPKAKPLQCPALCQGLEHFVNFVSRIRFKASGTMAASSKVVL